VRTSPRCTELLHEIGNRQHLGSVGLVCLQRGDLFGQGAPAPEPIGSLDQSGPDGLGSTQSGCFESAQGLEGIGVESN